jgi:hypothetical protein
MPYLAVNRDALLELYFVGHVPNDDAFGQRLIGNGIAQARVNLQVHPFTRATLRKAFIRCMSASPQKSVMMCAWPTLLRDHPRNRKGNRRRDPADEGRLDRAAHRLSAREAALDVTEHGQSEQRDENGNH